MISKNYKPAMKATVKDGQVYVTGSYLRSLKITSVEDQKQLEKTLTGRIICPDGYLFEDNAENRRILKVEEGR